MRVFLNEDDSHLGLYCFNNNIEMTEDMLKKFIYTYKDSDVTDFLLCLNSAVSTVDSSVFESYSDKYEVTEENGRPVDYKDTFVKVYHDAIRKNKLDIYKIMIDTLREINIKPWISFRMNDIHDSFLESSPVKPEYTDDHRDFWIIKNRPLYGYFDRCLNYAIPEVRDRMYEYIKEQLLHYDADGIELDFGREIYCFKPGKHSAGMEIMTEFIAKIRALADRVSKERNKKIEICLVNPVSPVTAYNMGFDISEIAKRELVDYVVASPRFDTITTNIPLKTWRGLLGKKIKLGAMQQLLVNATANIKPIHSDVEMAFGQAAAFSSLGADFIYLYNYMYDDCAFSDIAPTSVIEKKNNKYIIDNIGKTENVDKWTRRCPLTFDDSSTVYEPSGRSLPLTFTTRGVKSFKVVTGKFEKEQEAYIILGFDTKVNPKDLSVWANDTEAVFTAEHKEDRYILEENAYSFKISLDVDDVVIVDILSQEDYTLTYIEILLEGKE